MRTPAAADTHPGRFERVDERVVHHPIAERCRGDLPFLRIVDREARRNPRPPVPACGSRCRRSSSGSSFRRKRATPLTCRLPCAADGARPRRLSRSARRRASTSRSRRLPSRGAAGGSDRWHRRTRRRRGKQTKWSRRPGLGGACDEGGRPGARLRQPDRGVRSLAGPPRTARGRVTPARRGGAEGHRAPSEGGSPDQQPELFNANKGLTTEAKEGAL